MLKTNRFESFCRHPEKLFCIKDVGCVMGEVNGYFPKPSGLVKTRAISMSKAASLFKWPFVTRLLGLGLVRVFISTSLRPSKSTGYDRPSGRTWDWSSHRPTFRNGQEQYACRRHEQHTWPFSGTWIQQSLLVVCAFGCQAPGQGRGPADNAGSLSRLIVSKSRFLIAFKAVASTRPCHRPPNGLNGIRRGTAPPTHG